MEVNIPLTGPQKQFCSTDSAFPAIIGGLGSGKSRGGTMRAILKLIQCKGYNIGYYMPSYDLLKLRAMPGIEEDLTMLGLSYKLNKSDYAIAVEGYGSIIFRSYDRPERIVAYETAHSIVDELDTIPKEKASLVWRKISERNRSKCGEPNTIACVTTPDQGFNGFIYEKWYKKQQDGYEVIKAPTYSNPYLPDGYIQQIRDNYDPLLADMYIEGEIVNLSDKKVYHFFDRTTHNTDRAMKPDDTLHITIDFNVGGCCSNIFVLDGKVPKAVGEFVSHDTYDFVNNLAKYKGRKVYIYPDASGAANKTNATATDIQIIEQAGFWVDAPNKNPFVRDRVNCMNAKMSHGEFFVNTLLCPELTTALEQQGYNDKGEPEKFNDHPAMDDWVDGTGYFIHRRFPINKPLTTKIRFA